MTMKIIVPICIGVAIAAGGGGYLVFGGSSKPAEAAVSKAKVEKGPLRMSIAANGRVVSNLDVDIKCKASGEIIELPFDVSDPVKKGELIVRLDPNDEQRQVTQAQLSLQASKAKLETAKTNLEVARLTLKTDRMRAESALKSAESRADDAKAKADRMKQLLDKQLSSQEDYDTAQTAAVQAVSDMEGARTKMDELKTQEQALALREQDVMMAQTEVESDRNALNIAHDRLNDCTVLSPMDGVVTARAVQTGQIISSGISNVGGGTTVLTLSDLSKIFVIAAVHESDIGKVQVGQPVTITADAFPDRRFRGQVVRITTRGVNISNVVTFEVKIEVTSKDKILLMPEMTTNVEIIAADKDSVLLVPVEAISRKAGKTSVSVARLTGNEDREVKLGISDGIRTEVISGLNEGEEVVLRKTAADSRWSSQQQNRGPNIMPAMPPRGGGGGRR